MKQPNIMALCDKSFLNWFDKYIQMEEMQMNEEVYFESPIYCFRKDLKDYVAKRSDGLYQIKIDEQVIVTDRKNIRMLHKRLGSLLNDKNL